MWSFITNVLDVQNSVHLVIKSTQQPEVILTNLIMKPWIKQMGTVKNR